jgi:hypothetical protein
VGSADEDAIAATVAGEVPGDFAQVAVNLEARLAVGLFGRRLIRGLIGILGRFVGRLGHYAAPALDYR